MSRLTTFKDFYNSVLQEARFTSIEDNITEPEITPVIQKWIKEARKNHDLPNGEQAFRALVDKERAVLLGEVQIGRKTVRIWIQDIPVNGYWVEQPKKASYVLVSLDLIVNNPQKALSVIVHELIHGIQKYRDQSEEYSIASAKTQDETDEELFHYFTEPKETEAQLGQMGHDIVAMYKRKRNKPAVIQALEHVLRLPRESFGETNWTEQFPCLEMFDEYWAFLHSISKPPAGLKDQSRGKRVSDKCWRQFKQKLFDLVQRLKNS